MASLCSFDSYSHNKYSVLAVVFLSCGYLLSSVNRHQTDDNNLLVKSRPEQKWMTDFRNLSLKDSRVVLPEDRDYHRVVKASSKLPLVMLGQTDS